MIINVITIFPDIIDSFKETGFIKRAIEKNILSINVINLRDFSVNKHKKVDDKPFGGGPGMVLQYEPIKEALLSIENKSNEKQRIIYLSPQGKALTQKKFDFLSKQKNITLLCGRYEGVDQRVLDHLVDEEISLGDYVISGGEVPSMVIMEGVCRLLEGAIDDEESIKQDSFQENLLDHPHYTRPEVINDKRVPEVLLKGNHLEINKWRRKQALGVTWRKRPELLKKVKLSKEDDKLLRDYKSEFEET